MEPLAILQDLISIPSVNPMGRDLTGPEYFEGRVSDYLCRFFEQLRVPYERIPVVPGRDNVIARFDAPDAQSTIVMDAHQDTVPVDGMTIDPFKPVFRDGKIYGRGSCDVKGGMAAMLAAFARLVLEKPANAANVIMSCTCDEEATVLGICDLVKLWTEPGRSSKLIPKAPDVALVAEPTDLDIVVAHRGATRWKIKTTGRACHSSRPQDGINAIYRMAQVLLALDEYNAQLETLVKPHPLCGAATLSVGRIEGGISVNTVPDVCTIEIDRRVIPGEDGMGVIDDVATFLKSRLTFDVEMLPPWIVGCSLDDSNNGEWSDRLMEQIAPLAGPRRKLGVAYGTHASRFSAVGMPAMVFGPGSINQAHTVDEWLDIKELDLASEIYYRFCSTVG
ncbi:MAG: M20 family metallopeptidase [Planctomycetota bacterium]|nr:M20 family metallopeptidase [Planctomycetota bacterium]MDA1212505.1 M20 family metallopeptidase [Planctomycetota bacterium]